jgi:hypothetical protein
MLRIGDTELRVAEATLLIDMYAHEYAMTILFYDLGGDPAGEVVPSKGPISVSDIGRMTIGGAELTGADAGQLLTIGGVQWSSVAPTARLEDADPEEPDGIHAAMTAIWDQIRVKKSGIGPAKASKLLHLKRPFAFPLLDRDIFATYEKRYRKTRDYWELMRQDLIDGRDDLLKIRGRLESAENPLVNRVARLPAVRLIDILAWQLQQR